MALTYQLISSNVLASSAASITFSSIPATYTDLVIRMSVRSDRAATTDTVKITFNNDTSSIYSYTRIRSDAATVTSGRDSALAYANTGLTNANTSTANTFASSEIYIPSYTVSQNRPLSVFTTQEDNTTTAYIHAQANLYSSTTAISRIDLALLTGPNFLTGSSFYLYGIKNS